MASDVAQTGGRSVVVPPSVCGSPGADPEGSPPLGSTAPPALPGVVPGSVSPQRGPGRRQDRETPVPCGGVGCRVKTMAASGLCARCEADGRIW